MIDFLINNYQFLIGVLCLVIQLILASISIKKSTNKISSYYLSLVEKLPFLIIDAEEKGFSTGTSKRDYVVSLALKYLESLTGWTHQKVFDQFNSQIVLLVENILSTPQKKKKGVS